MADEEIILDILPYENSHRSGLTGYEVYKKYCEGEEIETGSFIGRVAFGGVFSALFNLVLEGFAFSKKMEVKGENTDVFYKKIDGGRKVLELHEIEGLEGQVSLE